MMIMMSGVPGLVRGLPAQQYHGCLSKEHNDFNDDNNDNNDVRSSWARVRTTYPAIS